MTPEPRALLLLFLVGALVASAGWAQDVRPTDRVKVRFFLVRDGRLAVSGYAGAGETVTVASNEDG